MNYFIYTIRSSRFSHLTYKYQQTIQSMQDNSNKWYDKSKYISPDNKQDNVPINKQHSTLEYLPESTIGIVLQQYQRYQSRIFPKIIQQFKKLNKKLQEDDFSSLLGIKNKINNDLNFINRNWTVFQNQIKQSIEKFSDLISIKLETVKFADKIYSHLIHAVKEINKKIIPTNKYDKNYKRPPLEDKISDMLFKHFIQQQETKSKREGIYFVKNQNSDMRIALSDYIAQCESLFDDYKWQQIYLKQYHYIQETQNDQATIINKRRRQKFDDNIHLERTPNIDCLGCTEFYYMNMNIYNHEINNCKMALVGSIGEITENSSRVKYEICALLNGGGGVLLFNCSRSYLNVIPRGQFLTQNNKAQIGQKIESYLKSIYPKPNIDQNVQVTFVPIKEDPFESDHNGQMEKHGDDGCYYNKRKYITGLYVTRIRVSPSNGRTTYLLTDNETRPYIPIRIKSIFDSQKSKIQIKGKEIAKFIKKRFTQHKYEINDKYSKAKKFLLSKKYSDFDHECKKPDSGQFIFNKQVILKSTQKNKRNEKDYRFASILVCRKQRHEQVKLKLKKHNINCEIEMPFENKYKLRGMNNSAIMYHNARFNELLQIISYKKEFQFDEKFTMVILITDYIRLPDRNTARMLTNEDLHSLEQWLMLDYPKQELFMWKYINEKGQTQIYLETGSKASSFFIYLILSNNGERAIFKNPKDIDINKVGRGGATLNNFIQIYPSTINSINSRNSQSVLKYYVNEANPRQFDTSKLKYIKNEINSKSFDISKLKGFKSKSDSGLSIISKFKNIKNTNYSVLFDILKLQFDNKNNPGSLDLSKLKVI